MRMNWMTFAELSDGEDDGHFSFTEEQIQELWRMMTYQMSTFLGEEWLPSDDSRNVEKGEKGSQIPLDIPQEKDSPHNMGPEAETLTHSNYLN